MDKTTAATLLEVAESTLQAFSVPDTFNGGQVLDGYLSQQSDHRYGAMVLYRVDGKDTDPQIIFATPKMHYPFDRSSDDLDRKYKFPKAVRIEVYEKLDGCNVCAYSYRNAEGQRFLTFKTRLVPVLQESKFGSFKAMWEELLRTQAGLKELVQRALPGTVSLSFEMYGYRNPHLIACDIPLAARLLFGVNQKDAAVLPPWMVDPVNPPKAEAVLDTTDGLVGFYEKKRAEVDTINKKVTDGEAEMIDGMEGYIFYLLENTGRWSQWKCKGSTIEAVHWASDHIPESIIVPTAQNALESCEGELTVDYIKKLLLEEFTQVQVDNSTQRIEKVLHAIKSRLIWYAEVLEAYKATGLTFQDGLCEPFHMSFHETR